MTVYECLISTSDIYMTGNNSNIPSITDWLMVGITVVYVIATVFICWANFSSARASKAQLEESKRQYEETKRLQMMPYFHCDFDKTRADDGLPLRIVSDCNSNVTHGKNFIFKNIGLGSAKDVTYKWNNLTASYDGEGFVFQSLQNGEQQKVSILFDVPRTQTEDFTVSIDLYFKDLLDNAYMQRIEFIFGDYRSIRKVEFIRHIAYAPQLVTEETQNV